LVDRRRPDWAGIGLAALGDRNVEVDIRFCIASRQLSSIPAANMSERQKECRNAPIARGALSGGALLESLCDFHSVRNGGICVWGLKN
jgi:hypothetical protein